MSNSKPKISRANEVFISKYLLCFNATDAYMQAYPKAKKDSARASAARLLSNVNISKEIEARLAEIHMSAEEALKLQADIARGDITEFFTSYGNLDFDKLRSSGRGRLVKKIKQKTVTKIGKGEADEDTEILETEIELYPADAAQERILKIHGKFKDTGELPDTLKIQIVRASDEVSNK